MQKPAADHRSQYDGADLGPCRRHGQNDASGQNGQRCALPIRCECAHHAEHSLGHHRDGRNHQAVNPTDPRNVTDGGDAIREQRQGNGRRKGKATQAASAPK